MKKDVKSYIEFINEKEIPVVYPTNFSGMVQGAVSIIHSQIMAIARELAGEKEARNPYRYKDADNKVGEVSPVDISRAINLIFHSDWKNHMKDQDIRGWAKKCIERAQIHDDRATKKNQRALRSAQGSSRDWWKDNLGKQGFSKNNNTK